MAIRPFPSFLIFKDDNRQFRWDYQESTEKSIAMSGEGYYNLIDCEEAIALVKRCAKAEIWETHEVAAHRKKGRR